MRARALALQGRKPVAGAKGGTTTISRMLQGTRKRALPLQPVQQQQQPQKGGRKATKKEQAERHSGRQVGHTPHSVRTC